MKFHKNYHHNFQSGFPVPDSGFPALVPGFPAPDFGFPISVFINLTPLFAHICSTSFPRGNQVDGLPRVSHLRILTVRI